MTDLAQGPHASRINRREFLYYLGGASLVLSAGATAWALTYYTEFPNGERFTIPFDDLPVLESRPVQIQGSHTWITHVDAGFLGLFIFCTYPHRPVGVVWSNLEHAFICPDCTARFDLHGHCMSGSPRITRGLNYATFEAHNGFIHRSSRGSDEPFVVSPDETLILDTHHLWPGIPRA
ncbi:MAG: hypothetical protein U0670_19840 [Anaerolineae bacterium]